jgi:hypothetical protein
MGIAAPAESPKGFPGVGQERGGEAAGALAGSIPLRGTSLSRWTGRGPGSENQFTSSDF